MAFHNVELFGHVVYSPDLSYDDLLSREEEIKTMTQGVLEQANGEFIHFEALGDMLRFQCVLPEERESAFHTICDNLAPVVKNGLDARVLMVDKDLNTLYFYSITGGKWQEAVLELLPPGSMGAAQPVKVMKLPTDHTHSQKK